MRGCRSSTRPAAASTCPRSATSQSSYSRTRSGLQPILPSRKQHGLPVLRGELPCELGADAARAARDDRDAHYRQRRTVREDDPSAPAVSTATAVSV